MQIKDQLKFEVSIKVSIYVDVLYIYLPAVVEPAQFQLVLMFSSV